MPENTQMLTVTSTNQFRQHIIKYVCTANNSAVNRTKGGLHQW